MQWGYFLEPTFVWLAALALAACIMGVLAHRYRMMRRERDEAFQAIDRLEALVERDPLTGLLNRRVVEERFAMLRAQGFDTFALIDLDKFKRINDRFGHQVGDQVLVACGEALNGDEERDHVTVRLGGEEFVVLLRGAKAFDRAETLRQSIPVAIADTIEGLDEAVTASMGLIELPRSAHALLSFQELYRRADALLYNAKTSGRDRTCFERLTIFNNAPPTRTSAKAAA